MARGELRAARVNFTQAQQELKAAQIRSPLSGTVIGFDARGQRAEIVDLQALRVSGVLADAAAGERLWKGQPVDVRFGERTVSGRIVELTREDGGLRVVASFPNPRGEVKPGAAAVIDARAGRAVGALTVPRAAVREGAGGASTVQVWRDDAWREVPVVTSIGDERFVTVKEGLRVGERVRLSGEDGG